MRALQLGPVLGLLFTAQSVAAVSATDCTRATLQEASAIVSSDRTHNQKLAALSALFRKFLDTDTMGRAVLGRHWSNLTPSQQKEFLVLFRELFERTYVKKLLLFENPRFAYVGETALEGGESRVDTKIITPRDEFAVVYVLRPEGQSWLATAIMVEDVSLTANLAAQFDRMLSRMSVEDTLDLLRRKYGRGTGEEKQL
jgi:ABC-type transporter MlaC component